MLCCNASGKLLISLWISLDNAASSYISYIKMWWLNICKFASFIVDSVFFITADCSLSHQILTLKILLTFVNSVFTFIERKTSMFSFFSLLTLAHSVDFQRLYCLICFEDNKDRGFQGALFNLQLNQKSGSESGTEAGTQMTLFLRRPKND